MRRDLTTNEIAEKYGVNKQVARRWCKEGRFPNAYNLPIKIGSGQIWMVPESDLKNFEPPPRGRKKTENPSLAALAKRKQREKENNEYGSN